MSSTNYSILFRPSGFTLIEMMIILGIISVLTGITLSAGIGDYSRGFSRADRETIESSLREARDMALHGICRKPSCSALASHGVFITSQKLVLFEGPNFSQRFIPADETIPLLGTSSVEGSREILFQAGSGNIAALTSFSIQGADGRTERISINTYGAIATDLEQSSSTPL